MGVAAIQFFALPPSPTRLDALLILPLVLTSVLASYPQKSSSEPKVSREQEYCCTDV